MKVRAQACWEPTCSVYHTKCGKGRETWEWALGAQLPRNVLQHLCILQRDPLNASAEEPTSTGPGNRAILVFGTPSFFCELQNDSK
jgi:hypothetical protein